MIPIARKPSAGAFAATCVLACMALGSFHSAAAQSAANGSNPVPLPSGTAKNSDKPASQTPDRPADKAAVPAPTPAPVRKPRVITNDDLRSSRFPPNDGPRRSKDVLNTGECDDACAGEAREMADFGPDQDGDWAFALTTARRNLALDTAWPTAIATLARAEKTYCTFQQQLQSTAVPSGDDYNSRVERARRQNYASEMDRVLSQNVTNANAQIDRMADQVEDDEPARAAIMRVLARRVTDSCGP
jgi:hypothetical protein